MTSLNRDQQYSPLYYLNMRQACLLHNRYDYINYSKIQLNNKCLVLMQSLILLEYILLNYHQTHLGQITQYIQRLFSLADSLLKNMEHLQIQYHMR